LFVHKLLGKKYYSKVKFMKIYYKAKFGSNYEISDLLLKVLKDDDIFFDVYVKDVECERRDETAEPQIWEVLNKDSAIEGMNLFDLNDDIPDEVKELLLK